MVWRGASTFGGRSSGGEIKMDEGGALSLMVGGVGQWWRDKSCPFGDRSSGAERCGQNSVGNLVVAVLRRFDVRAVSGDGERVFSVAF